MVAGFENQIQCQAQRRDHCELQAEAWIGEFGALEKTKAEKKAQDRAKQNDNQEKDTDIFVVPIRPRVLQTRLGSGPMCSQLDCTPKVRQEIKGPATLNGGERCWCPGNNIPAN